MALFPPRPDLRSLLIQQRDARLGQLRSRFDPRYDPTGYGPRATPPNGDPSGNLFFPSQGLAAGAGGGAGHGGGGGGGGGGVSAGHASAAQARAYHGQASLIDTNDPIYQLIAPRDWMSGMLAQGQEYISSATEDGIRLMHDQATRSGVSSSSPAYMYMVAMQRREQQEALANAMREANLAWTLPAADRRAGALGQNSQTASGVSMGNADADTRVSMANAGFKTETSIANAGFATQASATSAQLRDAAAGRSQQAWMFNTTFAQQQMNDAWQRYFQILTAPGGGGGSFPDFTPPQGPGLSGYGNSALSGGRAGFDLIRDYMLRYGVGGRPPSGPAPVNGTYYPSGD